MKPQLAISYPDTSNRHQFGGGCQVKMAEGGEKCDETVVDDDLVVKRNSNSAICVKHAEQLFQLLEETQPTSFTTCNTTIKTYMNNSKLT